MKNNHEDNTTHTDTHIHAFLEKIAAVSLDAEHKEAIKQSLLLFADTHPVVAPRERFTREFSPSNPVASPFVFFFTQKKFVTAFLIVMFISVGGVSFVAQHALPGDALYGIKTRINEPIVSFFSVGTKSEAIAEVTQAGSRLTEVEQLSSENKLSTSTQVEVKAVLTATVKNIAQKITTLNNAGDTQGAEDVASQFQQVLSVHRELLLNLSQQKTGTESNLLTSLVNDISNQLATSSSASMGITATSSPHTASVFSTTTPLQTTATSTAKTADEGMSGATTTNNSTEATSTHT